MSRTTMILGLAVICRAARKSAGTSVASIAAKAKVSSSTIHKFEQGRTWPRRVEAIVEAYTVVSGEEAHVLWKEAAASIRE
jgi:transcriptional regulator with XRE-family HTH domain